MAANEQMKKRFRLRNWKMASVALAVYDVFAVTFSYFFALWLRFDCHYSEIPREYLQRWLRGFVSLCFSHCGCTGAFGSTPAFRN